MKLRAKAAVAIASVFIALGGAVAVPSAANAQNSASDLAYAKCHYSKDVQSCKFLAMQGKHITKSELKCLAAAGIAVGGLFVGEGVGEGLALSIARKYVAAGAAGCLGSFL
ncbi:hypothetical protein [Curtobacterium flaccumfaciens]|uniref:hypothetical protein n=1 Tax=Curtobacterium flaccumfaciens TaxID=2035 RepID=UPI00112D9769|nr:hypothetical protein [Curtobacterium flaccumfaciens]